MEGRTRQDGPEPRKNPPTSDPLPPSEPTGPRGTRRPLPSSSITRTATAAHATKQRARVTGPQRLRGAARRRVGPLEGNVMWTSTIPDDPVVARWWAERDRDRQVQPDPQPQPVSSTGRNGGSLPPPHPGHRRRLRRTGLRLWLPERVHLVSTRR